MVRKSSIGDFYNIDDYQSLKLNYDEVILPFLVFCTTTLHENSCFVAT